MRIQAIAAVALLAVSAAAQAQDWDGDSDFALHRYVRYSSLISGKVEDARGHIVGRVVGVGSTLSGQIDRVDVQLTTPDEVGQVVSIDARDMILQRSPRTWDPTYWVQSTLTYPEIDSLPRIFG